MTRSILTLTAVCFLAGCTGMNDTQQRALTGTVGGAGVGAVLGAIGGSRGWAQWQAREPGLSAG